MGQTYFDQLEIGGDGNVIQFGQNIEVYENWK